MCNQSTLRSARSLPSIPACTVIIGDVTVIIETPDTAKTRANVLPAKYEKPKTIPTFLRNLNHSLRGWLHLRSKNPQSTESTYEAAPAGADHPTFPDLA